MIIKSLSLYNFRNLRNVEIGFNSRLNIIVGDNGQGKTNIIESIFLLTEGKSFRYGSLENLIHLGEREAAIRAQITDDTLDYQILCRFSGNKRQQLINGKSVSRSRLSKFSSVLFSPESLSVIKESSDERRKLIDQLIEHTIPNGYQVLFDYKKVLKTRNRLLKDLSENKIDGKIGLETLESLNHNFIATAAELTFLRIQTLNAFRPEVELSLNAIHKNGPAVSFDFEYEISGLNCKQSDKQKITEIMKKRMLELAPAELKSGVSLVGPHKHDIAFLYTGKDSRFYCSQGQQRSIILAYKMAQIVYHHRVHGLYPFLLLDDVLSELDLSKQESLISTLNQTETQTFVTTTDVSLLSKLSMDKASVFRIHDGRLAD